ncbi:helix-turn-helix transcriptional regulator [Nitrospira sp. NS4]|uniref:helix-turn-helix transcriptional regulator n=1 Tax=Nitrospira sp. NS4 TaxID=3414498 RepID=UPI003C2DDC55
MTLPKPPSNIEHPGQERSLFAVTTPQIVDGFQAAANLAQLELPQDRREQDLETFIPPLLHVNAKGKLLWASSPALTLLRTYWDWTDHSAQLPTALRQMLFRRSRTRVSSPTELRKEELMVERNGASLLVRLVEDNGRLWFLLDERSLPLNEPPMQAHGLTKREMEVLQWLAAGKSNKDIGTILAISPRTVEKHLERIFEHLGVETRTAAAAEFYLLNQQVNHSVLVCREEPFDG